jgi:hypothetical protein
MNWIKHLWFLFKHTKFHDGFIENPLMIRDNEIKTYFKAPTKKFVHGWVDEVNSWFVSMFGFCCAEVSWKDKYGKARFENGYYISVPFIQINFFGYAFIWKFECPCSDNAIGCEDAYWESLMDYYNITNRQNADGNLFRILNKNTWTKNDHSTYDMTNILTDDGCHKYLTDALSYKQDEI